MLRELRPSLPHSPGPYLEQVQALQGVKGSEISSLGPRTLGHILMCPSGRFPGRWLWSQSRYFGMETTVQSAQPLGLTVDSCHSTHVYALRLTLVHSHCPLCHVAGTAEEPQPLSPSDVSVPSRPGPGHCWSRAGSEDEPDLQFFYNNN